MSFNFNDMKFGWKPDPIDNRDVKFALPPVLSYPPTCDLRKKIKQPAIYNQGQLGSCHDEDTEVLTSEGWQLFNKLTGNEELATVNPKTAELTYELPLRIVKLEFDGHLITGKKNHSIDFRVTPDHKMLLNEGSEHVFVDAQDMGLGSLMNTVKYHPAKSNETSSNYVLGARAAAQLCASNPSGCVGSHGTESFLRGSNASRSDACAAVGEANSEHLSDESVQKHISMGTWLRFLGLWVSGGQSALVFELHSNSNTQDKLVLKQKHDQVYMTKETLAALELPFEEDPHQGFIITSDLMVNELNKLKLLNSEKLVPQFVFKQSPFFLREFLWGFYGQRHGPRVAQVESQQLADQLQLVAFLAGCESHVSQVASYVKAEWKVTICRDQPLIITPDLLGKEPYTGDVWCAEMPTHHTLVTRRNKVILVSGNCTANAIGFAYQYCAIAQQNMLQFMPSRLFIYYNEREMEGTVDEDAGAHIRDGMKTINREGVCDEKKWPYVVKRFAVKPPPACYGEASTRKSIKYSRVILELDAIKYALSQGFPVIFGFYVYESFGNIGKDGMMPLPKPGERFRGGHAVAAVGYTETHLIVRNSWGNSWGDNGYFYMPQEYVTSDNTADYWALTKITNPLKLGESSDSELSSQEESGYSADSEADETDKSSDEEPLAKRFKRYKPSPKSKPKPEPKKRSRSSEKSKRKNKRQKKITDYAYPEHP